LCSPTSEFGALALNYTDFGEGLSISNAKHFTPVEMQIALLSVSAINQNAVV
jgi:hypothetical protein